MAAIVQQISLQTDSETISATSWAVIANIVFRYWNSGWYDGTVEVYFEATLDPNYSGRTVYAALYDEDGNQVTDSEISQYGGDYNGPILKRSAALTLTSGKEYHVRAYREVGNGIVSGARLVVKQSGTITKTATYIDLAGLPDGTTAGNYGYVGNSYSWLYDADMYDGIAAAYFEAMNKHSTGAYTMGCELYNKTNSAQVAEITTASTSYVRQRSADIKASLTDGKEYGIRQKDGGGGTGYTAMGSIIIVQENFTKSCSLIAVPQVNTTNLMNGVHVPILFKFAKVEWACKTISAKFFAHAYGYGQTDVSYAVTLRRWNTTNTVASLSYGAELTSGSVPQKQVIDAAGDIYSSLDATQDYRLFMYAFDQELSASVTCYQYGLQVEFTMLINYTLAATGGTRSVTGTAATLKKSSLVGSGAGSYSVTGTAVTFTLTTTGPRLEAGTGSFAVTGTAAGLSVSHRMDVGAGSYGVTGTAAGLCFLRIFGAGPGSCSVTGTAATLTWIRALITLTAGSADFYILSPIGGKTLKKSLSLVPASPGSYAVTGTTAGLLYSRIIPVSPGSYAVTGTAASFLYNHIFTVTPGEYTVTGTAAYFLNGTNLPAVAGSFTITGTSASLCRTHIFTAGDGVFFVTSTAATLERTEGIMASPGEFSVAGTEAALLKHSLLVADPDKSTTVITRYVAEAVYGEFAQASLTTTYNPADLPDDIVIVSFALDSRAEVGSLTLGGRAFTRLAYVEGTGSGYHRGELWYMVNPPHEDSEFAIKLNDSQGTWTLFRIEHYYNVDQYDPFGDVAATFAAGQYGISSTVTNVKVGQFPFDWIVNTITWYMITPGAEQTVIGSIMNFGHFASAMSHRFGDTGDLEFSWTFQGISGDNIHIATVLQQPAYRNTFTIDGYAADLLKIVELTINDATHGITMSGTVLIVAGAYELVIDDCVHAVSMDNVALTMPDTLTINDAAHAVTMPNVALVMPGLLTIHDAVHPVTMPNIALGGIAYADLDAFINIGGGWKDIIAIQVQTGGEWKNVTGITLRQ